MPSLMGAGPAGRNYALDDFVFDLALGVCPLVVCAGLGLLIAGAEFAAFLLPTVVLLPIGYLTLGALLGKSPGNLWLKALCLCGVPLAVSLGNIQTTLVAIGLTVPFTALGLWLRRRGSLF